MTRTEERKIGDLLVVQLKDEHLIGKNVHSLMDFFQGLPCPDDKKIAVDFGVVKFIDSEFIGVLMNINTSMEKKGVALILFNVTGAIHDIFEITNMTNVFKIYATESEMLKKLSGCD